MLSDGKRYHKSTSGVVTIRQSTNVPSWGLCRRIIPFSTEIEVTTADASMGSTDIAAIVYRGEGSEYADICSRQMGLEFWLNGPAGTYNLHISNGPETLSWSEQIFLPTTDLWTRFEYRIPEAPGDLGTDWWSDSRVGYTVAFTLASGSGLQGAAATWVSGLKFGNAQSNLLATVGNKMRIAGLRVGPLGFHNAGGYQMPEVVEQQCQRYIESSFSRGTAPASSLGWASGPLHVTAPIAGIATVPFGGNRFQAPKRKVPSMIGYNPLAPGAEAATNAHGNCTATTFDQLTTSGFRLVTTTPAGTVIGESIGIHWLADASLPALTTSIGG
jgi:hypothetical protein